MSEAYDDFDTPWKQMLEWYFKEFMAFFFPKAHAQIDWRREVGYLDKELQQIVRDADLGRRYADKLVQVWLNDGAKEWVLVHIEVQGQPESDFARRMYTYHYRLFDRYNRYVASFAVLSDENRKWQPRQFGYTLLGSVLSLKFSTVKLLSYRRRWKTLESSNNPFATVVMAHLKTVATRHNPAQRRHWKFYLIRRLYDRGYSKQDVLNLLHFLDWLMKLPSELEQQVREDIYQLEARKAMPYISSYERMAKEEGLQQGLQQAHQSALRMLSQILEHRFGELPSSLTAQLANLSAQQLESLVNRALTARMVDDFATYVATLAASPTADAA